MFDDGGTALTLTPVGLSSPVTFHLDQQAGGNDPGFPVTMIRGRDTGRRRVHEENQPGYRFSGGADGSDVLMILGNPRAEALHVPDVLKLVASGMFLGFGFAGLMGMLNFPNSRKDQSRPPRNE